MCVIFQLGQLEVHWVPVLSHISVAHHRSTLRLSQTSAWLKRYTPNCTSSRLMSLY